MPITGKSYNWSHPGMHSLFLGRKSPIGLTVADTSSRMRKNNKLLRPTAHKLLRGASSIQKRRRKSKWTRSSRLLHVYGRKHAVDNNRSSAERFHVQSQGNDIKFGLRAVGVNKISSSVFPSGGQGASGSAFMIGYKQISFEFLNFDIIYQTLGT